MLAGIAVGCSPAGLACEAGRVVLSRLLTASSSVTGRCICEASRPAS